MLRKTTFAVPLALAAALALPAFAQDPEAPVIEEDLADPTVQDEAPDPTIQDEAALGAGAEGSVSVELGNVADDFAQDLAMNTTDVPLSVEAPIGIAADVCGISASTLAHQEQTGAASCTAQSSSPALEQIVRKEAQDTEIPPDY